MAIPVRQGLPLFREADTVAHAPWGQAGDGPARGPPTPGGGGAPAVEKENRQTKAFPHLSQSLLGLVKGQVGSQEAHILVGVGVADHHLHPTPTPGMGQEDRVREKAGQDLGGTVQVLEGLKQGYHVKGKGRPWAVKPHLPRQQEHRQDICRVVGHGNHMGPPVPPGPKGSQGHPQGLALGLLPHGEKRPGGGQFLGEKGLLGLGGKGKEIRMYTPLGQKLMGCLEEFYGLLPKVQGSKLQAKGLQAGLEGPQEGESHPFQAHRAKPLLRPP